MLRRLSLPFVLLLIPAFAQTSGWTVSSPEEQGMDPARLEEASQFIAANCPTRFSLLVVRNGRLVFERYYNGSRATDANNVKSMSKSMLSVLTGMALEEGTLRSLDEKLHRFFPEYFLPGDDRRKLDVTLEDLLTMRAGFLWGENTAISARCWSSIDWHRFVLESPLTSAPGEVFNYNTGLTHLLSGILTRASGMSTREYAEQRLFRPLGITCHRWTQDPRGYYFGGSEVWLTARDLAKFGLLALRGGRWENRSLVSEDWIRESTRLRVRTGSGLGDYAYLWWKYNISGYPVTLASGYGGQNIFLVPELDLLMVTTARSDLANQPDTVYAQPYEILGRYIIPAVNSAPPALAEGGVVNAADYGDRLAAGAFASAFGSGFSLAERDWGYSMPVDGRMPESLAGVRVRVGGRTAYPSYVAGGQVNFLIPPDMPAGRHRVEVITPHGRSSRDVDVAERVPAFFAIVRDGKRFAVPQAVRAGEAIELWACGLGPSEPAAPAGALFERHLPLAQTPEVTVAGRPAEVVYAALAYPGVCQVNIRIPSDVPPGIAVIELRAGGAVSRGETVLEIAP